MIGIVLMVIGGILMLIAAIGWIMYIIEPLIRNYRIVIFREDDYAHYTDPENFAMLLKNRREYCLRLAFLLILGAVLFFSGFYIKFGSRGLEKLLAVSDESPEEGLPPLADEELEINDKGALVAAGKRTFDKYLIVRGDEIYDQDGLIVGSNQDGLIAGDNESLDQDGLMTEQLENYIAEHRDSLSKGIFLADGYARADTFREVMRILDEQGIKYETTEQ